MGSLVLDLSIPETHSVHPQNVLASFDHLVRCRDPHYHLLSRDTHDPLALATPPMPRRHRQHIGPVHQNFAFLAALVSPLLVSLGVALASRSLFRSMRRRPRYLGNQCRSFRDTTLANGQHCTLTLSEGYTPIVYIIVSIQGAVRPRGFPWFR